MGHEGGRQPRAFFLTPAFLVQKKDGS